MPSRLHSVRKKKWIVFWCVCVQIAVQFSSTDGTCGGTGQIGRGVLSTWYCKEWPGLDKVCSCWKKDCENKIIWHWPNWLWRTFNLELQGMTWSWQGRLLPEKGLREQNDLFLVAYLHMDNDACCKWKWRNAGHCCTLLTKCDAHSCRIWSFLEATNTALAAVPIMVSCKWKEVKALAAAYKLFW